MGLVHQQQMPGEELKRINNAKCRGTVLEGNGGRAHGYYDIG